MSDVKSFEIISAESHITIRLIGDLPPETAKSFERALDEIKQKEPKHVIFVCEALSGLSGSWLRTLLNFSKHLKSVNKDARYVSLSDGVALALRTQGVLQAFPIATSVRAALVEFGLVSARALDVNFINPFLTATLNVLKVQAQTEATAGAIYKKAPNEKFYGDISGVIGLVSEAFSGSVVISFPESTFLKIMSRMLGETQTQVTKEIEDGAGELTNIIFGHAKVQLNQKGYGIKTAIPSVITGKDHSVQSMTRGPRMVIPFETDIGSFVVEVCLTD